MAGNGFSHTPKKVEKFLLNTEKSKLIYQFLKHTFTGKNVFFGITLNAWSISNNLG